MGMIDQRLLELGIILPKPSQPGKIDLVKICGEMLYCSGHGPTGEDGKPVFIGRVGRDLSIEQAQEAVKLVALNCLADMREALGTLDRIKEIVKVLGFVNSADDFHDQPVVMNAFTDLMVAIFGEAGRHARSAIGTSNLPYNIPVEVELIARIIP